MYYVRHMTTNASKKTGYINTKVTPAPKAEVVSVLERLGVSNDRSSDMFLSQVVLQQGLAFKVRIPNVETAAESTVEPTLENTVATRRTLQHSAKRAADVSVDSKRQNVTPPQPLDAQTQHAAKIFLEKIASRHPFHEALLFGSRARNTHTTDSDADIAVVLKGPNRDRADAVKSMAAISFHVMLETGVMVEALPLWLDEVEDPESFSNPTLIRNILREGIRL
jgi:uncharacterized protein